MHASGFENTLQGCKAIISSFFFSFFWGWEWGYLHNFMLIVADFAEYGRTFYIWFSARLTIMRQIMANEINNFEIDLLISNNKV